MQPDEVLEAASKLIEKPGYWMQRRTAFVDEEGTIVQACAVGAIQDAAYTGNWYSGLMLQSDEACVAVQAACRALERAVGIIPHWNDEPGRTADEVAEKMREAAADWRIEHEG